MEFDYDEDRKLYLSRRGLLAAALGLAAAPYVRKLWPAWPTPKPGLEEALLKASALIAKEAGKSDLLLVSPKMYAELNAALRELYSTQVEDLVYASNPLVKGISFDTRIFKPDDTWATEWTP